MISSADIWATAFNFMCWHTIQYNTQGENLSFIVLIVAINPYILVGELQSRTRRIVNILLKNKTPAGRVFNVTSV